jgi:hypothetical protein
MVSLVRVLNVSGARDDATLVIVSQLDKGEAPHDAVLMLRLPSMVFHASG